MSRIFALAFFCSVPSLAALVLLVLIDVPAPFCWLAFFAVFGLGFEICTADDEKRLASQPDTEKK